MFARQRVTHLRQCHDFLAKQTATVGCRPVVVGLRQLQTQASIISEEPHEQRKVLVQHASKTSEPIARTGLEKLPTLNIVRTLLLGAFFTSPVLYKAGFSILSRLATSNSVWTSPDRNPIVRAIVKPFVYDQFCAGTNRSEICVSRDVIKRTGYAGVILCYGKENTVSESNEMRSNGVKSTSQTAEINAWRDGNLETLDMIGDGDWIGIKFTGAGAGVTQALMRGEEPPADLVAAMDAICNKAATQNCRLWIDAEQSVFQRTIDQWAKMFMKKHNSNGKAVVYTTIQAYLKSSRTKLKEYLALAQQEGWQLAVKLVRGAYIANDVRENIHNTKKDTDDSYNGIVRDLLTGKNLGFKDGEFPSMRLFLAGHNPESVAHAWNLVQTLSADGKLKLMPDFGQLQGMAEELGCKMLKQGEDLAQRQHEGKQKNVVIPKFYKCLTWGSVQECMQYLLRRITENVGGADRMRDGMAAHWAELKRRMFQRS